MLAAGYGATDEEGLDWTALAQTRQPILLYMATRNLEKIAEELMRGGLPSSTPTAIVVAATMVEERVVVSTLGRVAADAREQHVGSPAIIVIGDIVRLRERLLDPALAAESERAR